MSDAIRTILAIGVLAAVIWWASAVLGELRRISSHLAGLSELSNVANDVSEIRDVVVPR